MSNAPDFDDVYFTELFPEVRRKTNIGVVINRAGEFNGFIAPEVSRSCFNSFLVLVGKFGIEQFVRQR